jgi:hypothetical protein
MAGEQPASGIRWRRIIVAACFIAVLVAANLVARDLIDLLSLPIRPSNEDRVHRMILLTAALYALLLAVPFVPGVEIGVALIVMLGPRIALLIYLCTLAGLSLSFLLGRLIPLAALIHLAKDLKLRRTRQLLEDMEPLGTSERLNLLIGRAPGPLLALLLRHRYLALAVAFNIPGNYIIGGGGGIALFAGASRLFSITGFCITLVLAVAPVPLAVMFFGVEFLSG